MVGKALDLLISLDERSIIFLNAEPYLLMSLSDSSQDMYSPGTL